MKPIRLKSFAPALALALGLAAGAARPALAQLPADAVDLAKVKIPEAIKSADLDPVTLEPADAAGPAWEYKGVAYRGSAATSQAEFMKDPDAKAEAARKERWVRNFMAAMSKVWCPVTDEITPGGLIQWDKLGITWESCCAFCDESVADEDFPKALDRLKERAAQSFELTGGKYVEGAPSPLEGAMREAAAADKGKPAHGEGAHAEPPAEPAWLKGVELKPTYSGGVALVFQNRCLECHRAGGLAPMSFMTINEIKKWSKSLKNSIASKAMPPWPATGSDYNFASSRALTDRETVALTAWIDAGYPAGDGPPKVMVLGDWMMGTPDAVIDIPAVELGADEVDPVRELTIPTALKANRVVIATEAAPGNEFMVASIQAGPLGAYLPGNFHQEAPAGTGRLLKAGEAVKVRVAYKKDKGSKTSIAGGKLAVKFAPEGAEAAKLDLISDDAAAAKDFKIPAGAADTVVKTSRAFEGPVNLVSLTPVINRRGKSLACVAKLPDGSTKTLLEIGKWSPDTKFTYAFDKPVALPKGSVVEITAHYDNSKLNVNNPDASAEAGPGAGETLEGWIAFTEGK